MMNLIGRRCGCRFDMPDHNWPVPGFPAWVVVLDVQMPMVEMASSFSGDPFWINASQIAQIWDADEKEISRPYSKLWNMIQRARPVSLAKSLNYWRSGRDSNPRPPA